VLAIAAGHLREIDLSRAARCGRASILAIDQDEESLEVIRSAYGQYGVKTLNASVRRIIAVRPSAAMEMPRGDAQGRMHGFQLWANLPRALKMTAPRYQDVLAKDIPEITDDDGTHVRVVIGEFWGKKGPVEGIAADPRYLDVSVAPNKTKRLAVDNSKHAFAYVFAGHGAFRDSPKPFGAQTRPVGLSGNPTPSSHCAPHSVAQIWAVGEITPPLPSCTRKCCASSPWVGTLSNSLRAFPATRVFSWLGGAIPGNWLSGFT